MCKKGSFTASGEGSPGSPMRFSTLYTDVKEFEHIDKRRALGPGQKYTWCDCDTGLQLCATHSLPVDAKR